MRPVLPYLVHPISSPTLSPFLPLLLCLLTFFILSHLPYFHFLSPVSPATSFSLSVVKFFFIVSCIFLADMDAWPFIHPLPTPHHPHVLKPTNHTKSPHKYQPSSSNQPNCSRTPCLRETFFFAGKHYLMEPNQPLRTCRCLIIKNWFLFFFCP